jgi:hypothetical protein
MCVDWSRYVFGERWPLDGGLGVGQLQWRPPLPGGGEAVGGGPELPVEQLAMVEYDYSINDAVVKILTLGSGHKAVVTQLNASVVSGEPRWSPEGLRLAFVGFAQSGNWINIAQIQRDGSVDPEGECLLRGIYIWQPNPSICPGFRPIYEIYCVARSRYFPVAPTDEGVDYSRHIVWLNTH